MGKSMVVMGYKALVSGTTSSLVKVLIYSFSKALTWGFRILRHLSSSQSTRLERRSYAFAPNRSNISTLAVNVLETCEERVSAERLKSRERLPQLPVA